MSTDGATSGQGAYEQEPPIAKNFFVQKLDSATSDGSNMILRVEYYVDSLLPASLDIYEGGIHTKTLKDDGVFPDSKAGDFIYATYITQSISGFLGDIASREAKIANDGGVFYFEGHDGEFIKSVNVPSFDVTAFVGGQQVPVYQPILNVTTCEQDILKQNSLFITELDVVEDPARTYNVMTNEGNSSGVWTFGSLMLRMANPSVTGVSTKNFLKEWVRTWLTSQSIGSFAGGNNPAAASYNNVRTRANAMRHLIAPWLTKSYLNLGTPLPLNTNFVNDWETLWDNLHDTSIQRNAPFKLMAIVNRIDLRGNQAYNSELTNAGETRFIYTLIDPTTGNPPLHENPTAGYDPAPPGGFIDWIGMNVIIEYGNPFTDNCDLKSFAQQWYDLSSYPLGSWQYNDALELITNQVTDNNVAIDKNINNSALNQIRTNEKIFQPQPIALINIETDWSIPDWQLRQFELPENSNTGYLVPSVVTNTPVDEKPGEFADLGIGFNSYNFELNVDLNNSNNDLFGFNVQSQSWISLIEWIYGPKGTSINRIRASKGMHNIPEGYLGGAATIYKEMAHNFGLEWTLLPAAIQAQFNTDPTYNMPNELAKKIRHQVSLNTCQGCHGGENKTNFTMVFPRGYGQPANYWDPIPSVVTTIPFVGNTIDDRFESQLENVGTTYEPFGGGSPHKDNLAFQEKVNNGTNQIVSPFLTGRKYSNYPGLANPWQDDNLDDGNEFATPALEDDQLTGLFYVNDPSNQSSTLPMIGLPTLDLHKGGAFPQMHDKQFGHNDLEHRKEDLCLFINTNCMAGITLIDLMGNLSFKPFPLHAH